MKSIVITLLATATLALAALCVVQSRKVAQQQAQVAEQRAALEETNKTVAALRQAQEQNEARQRELLRRSDELVAQAREQAARSNQLAAQQAAAAAPAESASEQKEQPGLGSMLSKMMQDPETKKLIQQTQRAMMDQLYGPLIKELNLTPEEAQKFKDLLADNAMKATEQATAMFGALGSSNRTEVASQMEDMQKSQNDALKALLGDDRFQQYEEYQKTVGERTQLNMFKQQLGPDNPLSEQQTGQLLGLMKEEQQSMAASSGLPTGGPGMKAEEMQMLLSDEKLQAFLDNQSTVNQHVYDRAKAVLTPEQLEAFGTFQTNQLQMMRMGMTMARKMFGSQNKGLASPAPAAQ